jgi:hypothetical protein
MPVAQSEIRISTSDFKLGKMKVSRCPVHWVGQLFQILKTAQISASLNFRLAWGTPALELP